MVLSHHHASCPGGILVVFVTQPWAVAAFLGPWFCCMTERPWGEGLAASFSGSLAKTHRLERGVGPVPTPGCPCPRLSPVGVLSTLWVAHHTDKEHRGGQGAWPDGPWEQTVTVEEKMRKKIREAARRPVNAVTR